MIGSVQSKNDGVQRSKSDGTQGQRGTIVKSLMADDSMVEA